MAHPEDQILEQVCSIVFRENLPVYYVLDRSGKVINWGGCLAELDFQIPQKGSHISETVLFMEGILPFSGKNMEFSCIKLPSDHCIDALLFRTETGYGLIIWDSSKKDALLTRTQQEFNELSLMIERQKNRITQLSVPGTLRQDLFLEDLFLALNFAVLEMNELGHFILVGKAPPWIEYIPQSEKILSGMEYEEDVFSFLGNFIRDTKKRWAKDRRGTFKSGLWIEKDHNDQEWLFEATALDIHHRKLLVISHDVLNPNQTQSIIQKGRDLALHYHELKRSGRKLQSMREELEAMVHERTKDLEQANFRLAKELSERKKLEAKSADVYRQLRQSQKMEAIGTLAGGIAHDFNNILAAIIGFTELSLSEAGEDNDLKSRLEKVLQASDRAKNLVRQILTFSHQSDFEKQPLKLKIDVNEALNLLRASLPAIIKIKKTLLSTGYILADHTQIHQVIMNLCTNAFHAMKEKGGILTVQLKDEKISSDTFNRPADLVPGKYIVLTISDTGCGIPPDLVEKIFDPYFTTKDKDKGTGLGLSVVLGIISKSDGAITVDTTLGKGSTFRIYLPEFFPHVLKKENLKPLIRGNNEQILFVDDESLQTEMVEGFGNALGYRVTTCRNSKSALALFSRDKNAFDLVITDMVMPDMTGIVLTQKLMEIRPDLPVILCSGYSDDINKKALDQIGIAHYMVKPFSMADFAKSIHNALKKE